MIILTTFLSAFLLFLIQPMMGKIILPWFGGGSSIWTMAMFFYMSFLFLGYFYSYLVTSFIPIKKQLILHLFVIIIVLLYISFNFFRWDFAIHPNKNFISISNQFPEKSILQILTMVIGLPYFLLSTTSILLQSWFFKIYKKTPYFLYAFSNIGSFLAIFFYPFFIEPNFTLITQGRCWIVGLILYIVLMFLIIKNLIQKRFASKKSDSENKIIGENRKSKVSFFRYILWFFLPSLTAFGLLATTNEITQEIAPIPFLWLAPLALYLLTYIIAFSDFKFKWSFSKFYLIFFTSFCIFISFFASRPKFSGLIIILIYLLTLFLTNLVLHTELYSLKPPPNMLSIFYLITTLGGIIASFFISFIAPKILYEYIEFKAYLLCTMIILIFLPLISKNNPRFLKILSLFFNTIIIITSVFILKNKLIHTRYIINRSRNFYGVTKVVSPNIDNQTTRILFNGKIYHGMQNLKDVNNISTPTSYYSHKSGIGLVISDYENKHPKENKRVGIIGLGVGTIAAYCKTNDQFVFYEINPTIIRWSNTYFTYLKHCKQLNAKVDIIEGDARLSLEKNTSTDKFDILVIDAFTDDSIPVHLLTIEAIRLYLSNLKTDGSLVFHISNRNLDLRPILYAAAQKEKINFVIVNHDRELKNEFSSDWVILSRDSITISPTSSYKPDRNIRLWTDNYSNLFSVLKQRKILFSHPSPEKNRE